MNIINFFRYLKGYVEFEGKGGFTERFINLCAYNRIFIWDIDYIGDTLKAKIRASDYLRLRDISKRSGVRIRLIRKTGLYFFCKKKMDRVGLPVGIALYFIIIGILSCFVWTVDVSGNSAVAKENIMNTAKELGLFAGTYTPLFDERKAANTLAQTMEKDIKWAAINIKGSKAVIEVRENDISLIPTEDTSPSNIVADFDGIIISSEVYSGIGTSFEGSAVKKGDLLVSGVFENDDGSVSFIRSKGKITAEREKELTLIYNKNAKTYLYKNVREKYILYFFGIKIPLSIFSKNNVPIFKREIYAQWSGIRLPVGFVVKYYAKKEKTALNEKQFLLFCLESYSDKCYTINKNTTVISQRVEFSQSKNSLKLKTQWNCIDFIGENVNLFINQ